MESKQQCQLEISQRLTYLLLTFQLPNHQIGSSLQLLTYLHLKFVKTPQQHLTQLLLTHLFNNHLKHHLSKTRGNHSSSPIKDSLNAKYLPLWLTINQIKEEQRQGKEHLDKWDQQDLLL